jgi:hypothetical protein
MKKAIQYLLLILAFFSMILFSACSKTSEQEKDFGYDMNTVEGDRQILGFTLRSFVSKCLTREELAQLVYEYEKVQDKWSGREYRYPSGKLLKVPELQLITPGEHEHNENTRYAISLMEENEDYFIKGLEVSVMSDTSACKIQNNTQNQDTTENTEPVQKYNLRIERWERVEGRGSMTLVFSEDENYMTAYSGKLLDKTIYEKWPDIRSEYTRNGNEIIYKQWNVVATSHDDKPQETTWETWKLTYQDDKNFSASNLDDPDSRSYAYTFVEILDLSN